MFLPLRMLSPDGKDLLLSSDYAEPKVLFDGHPAFLLDGCRHVAGLPLPG